MSNFKVTLKDGNLGSANTNRLSKAYPNSPIYSPKYVPSSIVPGIGVSLQAITMATIGGFNLNNKPLMINGPVYPLQLISDPTSQPGSGYTQGEYTSAIHFTDAPTLTAFIPTPMAGEGIETKGVDNLILGMVALSKKYNFAGPQPTTEELSTITVSFGEGSGHDSPSGTKNKILGKTALSIGLDGYKNNSNTGPSGFGQ